MDYVKVNPAVGCFYEATCPWFPEMLGLPGKAYIALLPTPTSHSTLEHFRQDRPLKSRGVCKLRIALLLLWGSGEARHREAKRLA